MEFFAFADIKTKPEQLQALTVAKLNLYCAEINSILRVENENTADIYCLWGEFTVHRQIINGGVRFTMPKCPNALAWTITTGFAPEPEKVVIHATINRTEHEPDFVESIHMFMQAWKLGLEQHL
jgi:hypothetical protein